MTKSDEPRDAGRLREFHDERAQVQAAQGKIDSLRRQLNGLKGSLPVDEQAVADHLRRELGELKMRLNNRTPGLKMKEGGAKHQLKAHQGKTAKYSAGIDKEE